MEQRRSRLAVIRSRLRGMFLSKATSRMDTLCYGVEQDKKGLKLEGLGEEEEEEQEKAAFVAEDPDGGAKKPKDATEGRAGEPGEAGGDAPPPSTSTTLRKSVKRLHFGGWEEKLAAAAEIKRIARKDGPAGRSLAGLGVIRSLVAMLDSDIDHCRRLAVQALIELAGGSFTNKALMMEAGVLSRLTRLITGTDDASRRKECLILLFQVTSLAKTQFHFPGGSVIPALIEILDDGAAVEDLKLTCLGTLYNLSTKLSNVRDIVSDGTVIKTLVGLSGEKASSEMSLAALGNLVVTAAGRTALEEDERVPCALFEIVKWEDKPRSRELALYVLMVLAQRSAVQRRKMVESGSVPLLLELALLGTPITRKRALATLQWFKTDTQKDRKGPLSAGTVVEETKELKQHRRAMKKMVTQSLHMNLENITKRAAPLS